VVDVNEKGPFPMSGIHNFTLDFALLFLNRTASAEITHTDHIRRSSSAYLDAEWELQTPWSGV